MYVDDVIILTTIKENTTSGIVFMAGVTISSMSKKSANISLSTAKAEYIALHWNVLRMGG